LNTQITQFADSTKNTKTSYGCSSGQLRLFPENKAHPHFALRARRLFFFSAVNPVIETGGAWGESKSKILQRIPSSHVPATIFVQKGTDFQAVREKMQAAGLNEWPVIAKPDVGERGFWSKKSGTRLPSGSIFWRTDSIFWCKNSWMRRSNWRSCATGCPTAAV
jgi:hypothetical protein